jgi:histidinol-phosphate aminotransferase
MTSTRRTWLKRTGLLIAGSYLSSLESIAAPIAKESDVAEEALPEIIHLNANENPYGPSLAARQAMATTIEKGNRYPWTGIRQLKSALAAKNNLKEENVLVGAGSSQLLDHVAQYIALKKGNFVLADPTFNRWTSAGDKMGMVKIPVPLTAYKKHDLDAMLQAINKDTKLVYLCNPNNPTGTICNHEALASFIRQIDKNIIILADEAYIEYTTEPSLGRLIPEHENLIVLRTFSKVYGLAGCRVGYLLGQKDIIAKLAAIESGINMGAGVISIAAALATLNDEEFITQTNKLNEQARHYTMEQFKKLNIPAIQSHTSFIYFSLVNYPHNFFDRLKAANIEGTKIFEENGKWSRITVGTMEQMKQFIKAVS